MEKLDLDALIPPVVRRRRGRPQKHPLPESGERKKPNGRPKLDAGKKRVIVSVTLPPQLVKDTARLAADKVNDKRYCTRSQVIELALLDYLGKRGERNAEQLLKKLGQKAARVMHHYAKDGLMLEVYNVLYAVAAAVGEDWTDADYEPKPDELDRLRAENQKLRNLVKSLRRTDDAGVDEWLNRRHPTLMPDDIRDGTIAKPKRYLQPVAEPEPAEDDEENPISAMLKGGGAFLG